MSWRGKLSPVLTMLCMLCAVGFAACGSATAASQNGQDEPALRVTFTKPGAIAPFATTVHDAQAVTRLYRAALALPPVKDGAVYNCPVDDGGVYHLIFSGGQMKVHHMDLNASGCPFIMLIEENKTHAMGDAFISLFTKTVGLPSLDPTFPYPY